MLLLVLALLAIVVIAALVVAYVAYPQQGRAIPRASRLSDALQGMVDRTGLDPDDREATTGGSLNELHDRWREGRRNRVVREQDDEARESAHRR